ncbi:MAG TPA: dienelactone hydrolase family protein [Acidimicrobiales bacterium]|nr:dienelactone hydrolase family protein [Acidimicrobiales bacterium]
MVTNPSELKHTDRPAIDVFDDVVAHGVRERRFDLGRGGRVIPGLLWTPPGAVGPRPLVLVGHGAAGSKREDYVVALGRRLVRHLGYAAVAIDGPTHGDRRRGDSAHPDAAILDFAQAWSSDEAMTDEMVADWRATVDALQREPDVGEAGVGYWGLSMGTILGLPLVAAEARIGVAVLGLMGLLGPTETRLAADAAAVACPVLFLVQWDDELFARDVVLRLFDALGTTDKRLHAQPGRHGEVPREEFSASEAFLAQHLSA